MPTSSQWLKSFMIAALAIAALGCEEEKPKPAPKPAAPSVAPPAPSAPPVETAAPTPPTPVLSPKCPKDSSGEGTFNNPCEAAGTQRMMEVAFTGKYDDEGPKFRVINKSPANILHGKVVVYFYDKAGKQLEIAAPSGSSGKAKPFQTCSGSIFGGIVKPAEKVFLYFSCVKKKHVPEGTAAIEAEIQMVGFADESEKQVDYYWRNKELTPDERKKGGLKAKK
jgi:hypothetical protein